MAIDDINKIRRKIAEVDTEAEQLSIRLNDLYASRRFLKEQLELAEAKVVLDLATTVNGIATEVKDMKSQMNTIQKEKKKTSGHFAVLMRIVNALIDIRRFTTIKDLAKVAEVSRGSINKNNMVEVEKALARKGLKLVREETKHGVILRVVQ